MPKLPKELYTTRNLLREVKKKEKRQLFLWSRIGDGSNYCNHGEDLDAVISVLKDARTGRVTGWRDNGFYTENYSGQNYISLYWGDADGNSVKSLTVSEKRQIKNAL